MKRLAFIVQYLIIRSSSYKSDQTYKKVPKLSISCIYETLQAFRIAPAKHRVLQLQPSLDTGTYLLLRMMYMSFPLLINFANVIFDPQTQKTQ